VAFLERIPEVVARAREPFAAGVRTLDALHLASIDFLRAQGQAAALATCDRRMLAAARRMKLEILPLE
jgi:hypothetical protein